MALLLMAMLAPHVSQAGPGTAIKPLGASRANRGIRIWKLLSARAAERKDGASRSDPRRPGMVEDLCEIVQVIVAHRIRMQARRVRTVPRGVPIEPLDHRKVAAWPCNRNSPPIGAMERQAGACLRRPFAPRTPRNPIEAMSHQAPTTVFQVEVESFGGAIERPPARSKVRSSDMPGRFPVGRTRGTDCILTLRLRSRIRSGLMMFPVAQLTEGLLTRVRKSSPGALRGASTPSKEAGLHPILNRSQDQVANLDGALTMPQAGTLGM
ncbi:hypothetical protein [Bradyrhizobium australafricanum]|uniref:hypothetical protein n=1 Tax=Bradyrhizobium australafricanum TaxID=2821406 RepID=UPI001CE33D1E|nr:hypothetical protein [Bradyrhizobium australafricanum]MCA6105174.1 hypothetical protein [Bradyrhizobium australafricanum]